MDKILEQYEIDTLLSGDSGNNDSVSDKGVENPIAYDFSTNTMVDSRIPGLELINEKFARLSRVELCSVFRKEVDFITLDMKIIKYSQYVNNLLVPSGINVVNISSLNKDALYVFEPKLVYTIVDSFFGGTGEGGKNNFNRSFTEIEKHLLKKLLEKIFGCMTKSWEELLPKTEISYKKFEENINLMNVMNHEDYMVVSDFKILINGVGGKFHIAIPYEALVPIKKILERDINTNENVPKEWIDYLHTDIKSAQVAVKVKVASKYLTLREVVKMKEGDLISIELPEEVITFAEEIPIFKAKLGQSNEKYALKILKEISAKSSKE